MTTLLHPRLKSIGRDRRPGARRRVVALVALGTVFWTGSYLAIARVLRHFATVDPDLGSLLSSKLLALLFLLWLAFLLFSALLTALSQCFLARDLPLWLSSPIPLRRLFRVKLVEVAIIASWTGIFLAIPVWVAFGVVFRGGPAYYALLVVVVVCCVTIASALGILVAVALVNLFPARRARDLLSLVALAFVVGIAVMLRMLRPEEFVRPEDFGTWAEYLITLSDPILPWLPSYWASRVLIEILGLTQTFNGEAVVRSMGLLAGATLVSLAAAAVVFRTMYRTGYSKSQEGHRARLTRQAWWRGAILLGARPFPERIRAIIVKDAATFFRDPSQWAQLLLLVAVVAVYLYNFQVLRLDTAGDSVGWFMRNLLGFLNIALVGLVVTALAARFVLPGLSLEGNTMWVLRASPLTWSEILWAKFWGGFLPVAIVAEVVVLLSNAVLDTSLAMGLLAAAAVLCLSAAIVGLAVGLGAAHPRFDATDGAQVTAGYAGLLFMMLSAMLVLLSVTVLAWPVYQSFRATWLGWGAGAAELGSMAAGLIAVGALCLVALLAAMRTGTRRLEALEATGG
ncbi:MAG: putative ABC transporter permease subunit [Gemmatimonadota bacterium]